MKCPDCFSLEHDRDLLAELIKEQKGTITALNIALGGEDSTSTENLIDASEVDYAENGLIALCRELTAENVELNDVVILQNNGWSADYDTITRAEAVIEKCLDVIAWVDKYVSCAINGSIKEALAAITEYRDGK